MKSGNTPSRCRYGAAFALAASAMLLSNCTTIVSKHPIFPAAEFDGADSLLGVYSASGNAFGADEFIVEREDKSGLRIAGVKKFHEAWVETFYADAAAISLGDGDYALQVSCMALNDKDKWSSVGTASHPGYEIYGFALKDRKSAAFWIFENASGVDDALLARYGLIKTGSNGDKSGDDLYVLPDAMPDDKAKAFFRDLGAGAMHGKGSTSIIEQTTMGPNPLTADSTEMKSLTIDTPAQCRAVSKKDG